VSGEPFSVAGRVVIVTGATKGLGHAFATGLAAAGARVVVSSRKQELCDAVAAEIVAAGGDALPLAAHVGTWDALPGFVDGVLAHYGRVDGLVNNAGISPAFCALTEMTEAYWDKVMSTNVKGPLRMSVLVAPHMREAGGGSIVNVASIFGLNGAEGYVAYTASKAAIVAMTKTAALEHAADGIRVNAICPGGVSTPMNEHEPEGGVVPLTPLGRRADVSEISGAVAFLASDDASFVTGTELVIDGGYMAR
jgi:3alpha(or 20beta)-hydroxysteroid dehydrogenase